jgi:outer membrane receptor for ferrienterochelin and colicin
MSALRRLLSLTAVVLLAIAPMALGQASTTGAIAGVVLAADGSALPGVTVEAIHVPTGTRYDSVTNENGRYTIPNVRVGGPYRVTATLEGFRPVEMTNLQVGLGTTAEVPLTLQLATVSEAITVTATADEIINPNRTGATSEVSTEQIETLPTVNRSLQDFARTNPYFVVDAQDFSATRMNVAGRNNRYNSIQIDGAVNNDLFGLADTGTPGGQTDAQPISLDAVQELQLVVSPYDVRQGGFTGGGVNAVTRSGTNEWSGSVFGSQRSPDLTGECKGCTPVSDFEQDQYGLRLGGPIVRDRLFFFVNGEQNRKTQPTGFYAEGAGARVRDDVAGNAAKFRQILIDRYDYDPGPLTDFPAATNSDLAFARLDWNVNSSNQLTLRHNYVDAARDVWGGRSESRYTFETATYAQADKTNSSVAQLNSVFSANAYNEARVSLQTIRDERSIPVIFPSVEVGPGGARNGQLTAGTERFSGANALDQDIFEFTDDFTYVYNAHTLTVGTHNEFFEFKNLFLSEFYGYYYFNDLAAFEAGTPLEYRISFATGDDPGRPTAFEAGQYGFYVNDAWRVSDALSLTVGLRGDKPTFPEAPSFNENVFNRIGFRTDEIPSEDVVWSPRVGFNWQPGGSGNQQVRGGVGIFAGRTPYVWVSNAFANTGVESLALSCTGTCQRPTFNPDPFSQPREVGVGGALSVDLIDPDFEFPRVLRATLGYDRELFFGVRGSAEVLWSQTQQDVFYYNVNRVQTGVNPLDGRPMFTGRINTGVADAIQLSNTSNGQETAFTLQLSRPFSNGLLLSANYGHQNAESAFDATSSRAISNWQFRHTKGDIFTEDVSRSAFEMEHRFNVAASYNFATGPVGHTFGLYYNVQSGRPYSVLMSASGAPDMNGDGYTTNDLLYVPAAGQVIFEYSDGRRTNSPEGVSPEQAFFNYLGFLGVAPNSGRILDRYEFTEPWSRQLDMHYSFDVPVSRIRTEFTVDVTNLLNLVNDEWGIIKSVGNQNTTVAQYRGVDAATGKHIYRESFRSAWSAGSQFSIADTRSRWAARMGLRVTF